MKIGLRFFALAAVGALLLVGCGDDDSNAAKSAGETGEVNQAKGRKADRVVEVRMLTGKRFAPDTIAVKAGETITFKVMNEDKTFHQFVLGDEEMQASNDKEMAGMSSEPMDMDDQANSVTLAGGEAKELTWTFKEAGTVLYGCHQPGHYGSGMKGTVTVS